MKGNNERDNELGVFVCERDRHFSVEKKVLGKGVGVR